MFITPLSQLPSIFPIENEKLIAQQNSLTANIPFADVLKSAIQNMQETRAISDSDSYKLALGQTDDLHTVQINSLKAATAMDFTVGVASKAIGVYNEIMRMNI